MRQLEIDRQQELEIQLLKEQAEQRVKEEELKLELMRNKILGGVLVLVIFVLLVFK